MFSFCRTALRLKQSVNRCGLSLLSRQLFQSPRAESGVHCKSFSTARPVLLNRIASTSLENDCLKVQWHNGQNSEFHNVWLRDHCSCEKCFNHTTNQREYDMLEMPLDIKPTQAIANGNGEELQLTWPDGHVTVYNADWLMNHGYKTKHPSRKGQWVEPLLWNKERITSRESPKMTYQSILEDDKECFRFSHAIEQFGFAFVHETPTEVAAIENLAIRLGGFVRITNYGGVWQFSNEAMDYADNAYTTMRLEAHTDNTHFADPCGLQMLHCVSHDGRGGESLLVDGFNAADILKQKDFEAFKFLSTQKIPFHFKDNSIHVKANGHVIELDPFWNDVRQIRFNTYHRDILDCLLPEDVPKFYRAFKALAAIIRDPENEFWFKLKPGVCMIMANWRVMHGRSAFAGVRVMQGCYASKDDFQGQFRSKYKIYNHKLD